MAEALMPIAELVPHDPPMILLDELLEVDEQRLACALTIDANSPFLGCEGVPAYVGIEYMAQAVAAHGGYLAKLRGEEVRVGFLLGSPSLSCQRAHFPLGSRLRVDVARDWGDDELMRFHCKICEASSGDVWMEAGLNVFQPKNLAAYLAGDRPSMGGPTS